MRTITQTLRVMCEQYKNTITDDVWELVMCEHYESTIIDVWELITPCDVWKLWKHYHWCLRTDNNGIGAVQTDRSPLGRDIQVIMSQRNWFAIMSFNHMGKWKVETQQKHWPGTEIRKGISFKLIVALGTKQDFPRWTGFDPERTFLVELAVGHWLVRGGWARLIWKAKCSWFYLVEGQRSGAVRKSRWPSRASVHNKPTVSVDVKQHSTSRQSYLRSTPADFLLLFLFIVVTV